MNRFFMILALSCFGLQAVAADAQTETTSCVACPEEVVVGIYDSTSGLIFLSEESHGMRWAAKPQDEAYAWSAELVDFYGNSLGCSIKMRDGENDVQGCYLKQQENDLLCLIIATGQAAQKVAQLQQEAALKTETVGELVVKLNRSTEEFEFTSSATSLGLWEVNPNCESGTLNVYFSDFDRNPLDCKIQIIEEAVVDAYTLVAKHTAAMKAALAKRCAELQEQKS